MTNERVEELREWNNRAGLLKSEVKELLEAVENKNKEIAELKNNTLIKRFKKFLARGKLGILNVSDQAVS
jgi:TATA-binding protein-associated factor Taf7